MKRFTAMGAAAAALWIGVWATAARAQPLAERVPGDAIAYVGWAGVSELGAGYEKSHLKALVDASGVGVLVYESLGKVIERIPEREPREALGMMYRIAGPMLAHPTAAYLTAEGPAPGLVVMCAAGKESAGVAKAVGEMVKVAGEEGAPLSMTVEEGGLVVLRVNTASGPVDRKARSLAGDGLAARSLKRAMVSPVVAVYVSGGRVLTLLDGVAASGRDADEWALMKKALSLEGIRSIAWGGGFEGRDWMSGAYVDAPLPRKGIATLLDMREGLSEEAWRLVPRTASMAGGGRADLVGIYDALMEGVGKADAEAWMRARRGVKAAGEQLGFDLRADLLGGLGDEWVWYADEGVAGPGMMGTVLVNRLRKPREAERAVETLIRVGKTLMAARMRGAKVKLEIREAKVDGVSMWYLATPVVSPAIAFRGGRMYVGLYPNSVSAAVGREGEGGSILENEAFRERLAVWDTAPASFEYYDVERLMPAAYSSMMMLGRTVGGMADLAGGEAPARVVPSLRKWREHASPATSFAWADEEGWYMRSRSFMPGASAIAGLTSSDMATAQAMMWVGAAAPAIDRSRDLAQRAASAARLRGIAQAIIVYDAEHKRPPHDFGQLVKADVAQPTMFVHPKSPKSPPAHASREKLAEWVVNNSDYVYLSEGERLSFKSGEVLAYERPDAPWTREGLNIAFGDGAVRWHERREAMKLIEKAKRRAKQAAEQEAKGE